MQKLHKKSNTEIIQGLIEDSLLQFPVSSFLISIFKQHQQRGFLTKKQLQGLHKIASEAKDIPAGRLATLEAIINKMPNRYKSDLPENKPLYEKDEAVEAQLNTVLQKFPQHKRALFLKHKFDDHQPLTTMELSELKKFYQLALK